MELSAEDALRLNVMLANELHAVRIDESSMTVYGLSPAGETAIRLNPTCRDEQYIRQVKELLSSHVLGSPGGYPVYLKRWTRMGQARDTSLEKLLLLGEPEAVVAVVHAQGLTGEIARRAWWAMPTSDNARRMLAREAVARSEIAPTLAEFLIEFLPFEESHQAMIESVRLVLQPGLIDEETRDKLWAKGRHKNTYYVGFLHTTPDELPERQPPHPLHAAAAALGEGPQADFLRKLLDVPGQSFLHTAGIVLKKPNNQDVVVELMEAIRNWFAPLAAEGPRLQDIDALRAQAAERVTAEPALAAMAAAVPELAPVIEAACLVSGVGERLVAPVFARTDAIGSVMRRKLAHITEPLGEAFGVLRGR